MNASSPAVAIHFGIGFAGSGATLIQSLQALQPYFILTVRITFICAGIISSCSETSSPIFSIIWPSYGQALSFRELYYSFFSRQKSGKGFLFGLPLL